MDSTEACLWVVVRTKYIVHCQKSVLRMLGYAALDIVHSASYFGASEPIKSSRSLRTFKPVAYCSAIS